MLIKTPLANRIQMNINMKATGLYINEAIMITIPSIPSMNAIIKIIEAISGFLLLYLKISNSGIITIGQNISLIPSDL
jgi:hypothetical protein